MDFKKSVLLMFLTYDYIIAKRPGLKTRMDMILIRGQGPVSRKTRKLFGSEGKFQNQNLLKKLVTVLETILTSIRQAREKLGCL